MKKLHVLPTIALFAAMLMVASCGGGSGAKEVSLKNQADSLNYALGIMNGKGIKDSYFSTDSTAKNLPQLLEAADKAFNNSNKDELYNYGKQMGSMLKQQKKNGLMHDSTLVFNESLIVQGLINGLKGFDEGMTREVAQNYLQTTMQKRQERNLPPMPETAPELNETPADTVKAK